MDGPPSPCVPISVCLAESRRLLADTGTVKDMEKIKKMVRNVLT